MYLKSVFDLQFIPKLYKPISFSFLLLSGILYQDEPVMISITNSTNDLNSTLQNLTTNSNIRDIVTSSTTVSVTVL